jgi:hypothetical protein
MNKLFFKYFLLLAIFFSVANSGEAFANELSALGIKTESDSNTVLQNQNVQFSITFDNGIIYEIQTGFFIIPETGNFSLNTGVVTAISGTFAIAINGESAIPLLSPGEIASLARLTAGDKISLIYTGEGSIQVQKAFLQIISSGI